LVICRFLQDHETRREIFLIESRNRRKEARGKEKEKQGTLTFRTLINTPPQNSKILHFKVAAEGKGGESGLEDGEVRVEAGG
jgi:hypothetical protein